MTRHIAWTDENLAQLADLWKNPDLSAADIARLMNTSKGSILGKAHRIGLAETHPKTTSTKHNRWLDTPKPRPVEPEQLLPHQLPPPPPPAEKIPEQGVSLFRLKGHHCRWIIAEQPEHRFCAKPKVGKAFCEEHTARAYVIPPSQQKKRAS